MARALRIASRSLLGLVVFVVSLVLAVFVNLSHPLVRRVAREQVNAILEPMFKGRIVIDVMIVDEKMIGEIVVKKNVIDVKTVIDAMAVIDVKTVIDEMNVIDERIVYLKMIMEVGVEIEEIEMIEGNIMEMIEGNGTTEKERKGEEKVSGERKRNKGLILI